MPVPTEPVARYVFANSDVLVMWGGGGTCVTLHRGEAWHADDPFVIARADLFNRTPPVVHSTVDRPAPESTPLAKPKRRRA